MKNVFPKFKLKQLDPFISVIVIFIYNVVLDKDMECLCEQNAHNCNLYMALPFFIIFVVQLTMDRKFQRPWRCTSTCTSTDRTLVKWKNCTCSWIFFFHIWKAAFIGLLWVVSLLIDGDWFVCCYNRNSDKHPDLACKDEKLPEEKKIFAQLKNKSWNIGMSVLIISLILTALMSPFGWIKFCNHRKCCKMALYNKAMFDEEENVLQEILKTAAKAKLTSEVNRRSAEDEWKECFGVAEENQGQQQRQQQEQQEQSQEAGLPLEELNVEQARPMLQEESSTSAHG